MKDDRARLQGRLDLIATAVRDWKGGTISAPEAIARVAQIVRVPLDAADEFANIDASDPRLALRAIVKREADRDGAETVTLECGHVSTQIIPIQGERMRCAQCINEIIDERRRK